MTRVFRSLACELLCGAAIGVGLLASLSAGLTVIAWCV